MCACSAYGIQKRASDSLEAVVHLPTLVPGAELIMSTTKTVHTLNHQSHLFSPFVQLLMKPFKDRKRQSTWGMTYESVDPIQDGGCVGFSFSANNI